MDLYVVVGGSPDSSRSEIDQAYEDLTFQWHPDKTNLGNKKSREISSDSEDEELYGKMIRAANYQAQTVPLHQFSLDIRLITHTKPEFLGDVSVDVASPIVIKPVRVISRRDVKKSKKTWVTVQTTEMSDGSVRAEVIRTAFVPPSGSVHVENKPEASNGARKYARRLLKPVKREFNKLVRETPEVPAHWDDDPEEDQGENINANDLPALERNDNILRPVQ
jgi:hypothetical protein